MQPVRTILVTGATGAIGSALVAVLLEEPETQLKLLIRAKSQSDLDARLEAMFGFWHVGASVAATRFRVLGLRGDVTAPQFGLDPAAYADLRAQCTHIVHASGAVRMNLPIEDARRSAIDSARNIVALARACASLVKLEFVSTVGVGGRMGGTLRESWIDARRSFHNTYEQAKAEAEDYIRSEIEHGLPVTVHRPSMVVGDSRTGRIVHFQVFYHLCEFLSGRRTIGLCPSFGASRLDIVPADYVAKAIAWSIDQSATVGRILHLCSGPEFSISLKELQHMIRAVFTESGRWTPPLIQVSPKVFEGATGALAWFVGQKARRALRTLPVFLEYLDSDPAFGNAGTQEMLVAAGLPLPRAQSYLPRVLRHYVDCRDETSKA